MNASGRIGVVVPVYNGARYLDEALASLERCHDVGQVVVVDDASTDASREIAGRRASVTLLSLERNVGQAEARNRGVDAIDRDFVGFLDADDRWTIDGADPRLAPLVEEPAIDIVASQLTMLRLHADGRQERSSPRHYMQLGTALVRRQLFERVGGFDATAMPAEDLDWFARAKEAGARIEFLAVATLDYRRHAAQLTHERETLTRSTLLAVRHALDRRRR